MAREIRKHVEYYYDSHSPEEDLIDQTVWHTELTDYLKAVLNWLFHDQDCAIYRNLSFYHTLEFKTYPLAPDLAVIKGVPFTYVSNWVVGQDGPAPHVVFEILSDELWEKQMYEKPRMYANIGVQEYFAYDPYKPPISQDTSSRLSGWRLDAQRKEMISIIPNAEGWLWSEQLAGWLVPDGRYLRLYDRQHQLYLTETQTLTEKLRALGINPDE